MILARARRDDAPSSSHDGPDDPPDPNVEGRNGPGIIPQGSDCPSPNITHGLGIVNGLGDPPEGQRQDNSVTVLSHSK